jgi:hypothetical protein
MNVFIPHFNILNIDYLAKEQSWLRLEPTL